MLQLRIFLRALAYILHGRAAWMDRKALDNRRAAADDPRRPKRLAGDLASGDKFRWQATAVGRLTHQVDGSLTVGAALAGYALGRATGDLSTGAALRAEIAATTDPETARWLATLVKVGVLPTPKEEVGNDHPA